MIAERLKKAIFQFAIQGKLTEQHQEDGNAKDLVKKIQIEKLQLVRERKLKKEKPVAEIAEEEVPFEIPENWCWVRMGSIATKITDGSHNPPPNSGRGYPVISAQCVQNGRINLDCVDRFTNQTGFEKENPRTDIKKGDIILGIIGGSIGNLAIYDWDTKVIAQRSIAIINSRINNDYLYFVMKSPYFQQTLNTQKGGTAQGGVYLGFLQQILIPIPPLTEQQRIVSRVEELMPQIDILKKDEKKLLDIQKTFPNKMKQSLLQAAIQGKLSDQLQDDGNARDLVEEIQKEKAKLTKAGKIKKERPLPEIIEDEIPFEIPENWCWVRLGEIGSWGAGATPNRSNLAFYTNGTIPWLKTGDLNDGIITEIPEKITELALHKTSVKLNVKGSVLIAMYGATIGKIGILDLGATTNQACCACETFAGVLNRYLFFFLMSHRKAFIEKGAGGAQPNISKDKVITTLIPLPPLLEQKRIVARLDELLPLCDKLE